MRLNKKLTVILAVITIVSFASAMLLEYSPIRDEVEFWVNVLLGIFSGAFLTVITSIISYQNDKRKTLENFYCHTKQLLSFLDKYQENMSIEQKLHFYLDYFDFDQDAWNSDFGEIDFFFDFDNRNKAYIYDSIYKPLLDFNDAIANHVWHFRWYLDGTGKNETVIKLFLDELQLYLLEKGVKEFPKEYDTNGNTISTCKMVFTTPKLTRKIRNELSGHYYEIMYGRKSKENTVEDNHGQP